jgi:molybdopterin converting factor small subunit
VGRDGPEPGGRHQRGAAPAPAAAAAGGQGGQGGQGRETGRAGPVTVLFFAGARDAAGVPRAVLPAAGTTVSQLVLGLRSTYGDQLGAVLPSCSIWVNRSPAEPGLVLQGGDEVALMPPVSGG